MVFWKPSFSIRQVLSLASTSNASQLNCIEINSIARTALSEDIFRIFSSPRSITLPSPDTPEFCAKKSILGIVRHYGNDFRPNNRWIVAFDTPQSANRALNVCAGALVATRPPVFTLVPSTTLNQFHVVNTMVEDVGSTLISFGFLPGNTPEEYAALLHPFKLRTKVLGSPIHTNEIGKYTMIEFASKDEAHNAFMNLNGKELLGMGGVFKFQFFLPY